MTENQIHEISAAGFKLEPRRVITETISGSTAIALRRGFMRLLDKLEADDVLILTKVDPLAVTRSMSARPWQGLARWAFVSTASPSAGLI
jgi:DNA invertase Pin-like site-specific DNA recombinase